MSSIIVPLDDPDSTQATRALITDTRPVVSPYGDPDVNHGSLHTLSLVKALYDEHQDYIDTFRPFVITCMNSGGDYQSLASIQSAIEAQFQLNCPIHALGEILTRAKRKGLVTQRDRAYSLTPSGQEAQQGLELEQQVQRRINRLVGEVQQYMRSHYKLNPSTEEAHSLVVRYASENLKFIRGFVNPRRSTDTGVQLVLTDDGLSGVHRAAVSEFVALAENENPEAYNTFMEVVLGGIISSVLHAPSISSIDERFRRITVYIDTNVVFHVLGLTYEDQVEPTRELISLLRQDGGFRIRVFDFTIDEATSVLAHYEAEYHRYSPQIKVNSIYSSLRSKGYTPADVRSLMANIELLLGDFDIGIVQTGIDLDSYEPHDAAIRAKISEHKVGQSRLGQNHDIAAIEQVSRLRRSRPRRLEESQALFLSADLRLARFNFDAMGHARDATICEVIPDRVLTSILWLKKPSVLEKIPLQSIIAMYSKSLFVDRAVWRRFISTLQKQIDEGDLTIDDAALLLYDHRMRDALRSAEEDETDYIDRDWILERLEDARTRQLGEHDAHVREVQEQLAEHVRLFEAQSDERVAGVLRHLKAGARRRAGLRTRAVEWTISVSLTIAWLLIVWWLWPRVRQRWPDLDPLLGLLTLAVPILLWILGLKFNPWQLRSDAMEKLFNFFYVAELRSLDLEEMESIANRRE